MSQLFFLTGCRLHRVKVGISRLLRLEPKPLVVRCPASTHGATPAPNPGTAYPRLILLMVQKFNLCCGWLELNYPAIFIIEGLKNQNRKVSVLGPDWACKMNLPLTRLVDTPAVGEFRRFENSR